MNDDATNAGQSLPDELPEGWKTKQNRLPKVKGWGRSKTVRERAESWEGAARLCWILALIFFVVGILGSAVDEDFGGAMLAIAGGFIPLGLVVYLIGQVMHIRGNTEK